MVWGSTLDSQSTSKSRLKKIVFLKHFQFQKNLRGKYSDFLYTPAPNTHNLPPHPQPPPDDAFVRTGKPASTRHHHAGSTVYIWAHCCVVHSVGLDKCVMMCFHHYSVTQSVSPPSQFLVLHLVVPLPQPLATTHLFTLSIGLSFPECHIVGIIHYCCFL